MTNAQHSRLRGWRSSTCRQATQRSQLLLKLQQHLRNVPIPIHSPSAHGAHITPELGPPGHRHRPTTTATTPTPIRHAPTAWARHTRGGAGGTSCAAATKEVGGGGWGRGCRTSRRPGPGWALPRGRTATRGASRNPCREPGRAARRGCRGCRRPGWCRSRGPGGDAATLNLGNPTTTTTTTTHGGSCGSGRSAGSCSEGGPLLPMPCRKQGDAGTGRP